MLIETIGTMIFGVATPWVWKKLKEPHAAIQELDDYFDITPVPAHETDHEAKKDLLALKANLYGSSKFTLVNPDILIEREQASEIQERIKKQETSFLHIHVYSKIHGQGISLLLKNLHMHYSRHEENAHVLRAKDFPGQHHLYKRSIFKKLVPFFNFWEYKHLVLLLDDAFAAPLDKVKGQQAFVSSLANFEDKRLKITVVSGGHGASSQITKENRELILTRTDERRIFNAIFKEPPVLVKNSSVEIETFWGWSRGKKEYGNDLSLFLSLLYDFAKENRYEIEEVWKTHVEVPLELISLDENKKELIKVVAVYSVIECPLSQSALRNINKEIALYDSLEKLPWVIEELNRSDQKCIRFRPAQARRLLGEYGINTAEDFREEYKRVFNLGLPFGDWEWEQQDLLRHLFRRLNDDRYKNIEIDKTIKGSEISKLLFSDVQGIQDFLKSCSDVGIVCAWANTALYVNDIDLLTSQYLVKHMAIVSCGFRHHFCSHNS